jgi:signal peptidase I
MVSILKNKWFKFSFFGLIYLLWVIWLNNYWWLLGMPVIYDIYISHKVHWAFWKKKGVKKQTALVEWIDALIFAVVAATVIRMFLIEAYTIPTSSMEKSLMIGDYLFVSKVSYGPKLPNTPLSFPFVHNKMPLTRNTKSYLEWIQNPYKRLAGLGEVERGDAIVFNFPDGDTVASDPNYVGHSYYNICRAVGRETVWRDQRTFGPILTRPVDKRENYIKRCVGLPGDTLEIKNGILFVNGKESEVYDGLQYNYEIRTTGKPINPKVFDKMGIPYSDYSSSYRQGNHYLPLNARQAEELRTMPNVVAVVRKLDVIGKTDPRIFPHSLRFNWNEDNFGPLVVPAKGISVQIDLKNLPIYQRIIEVFEENKLEIKDNQIYINDLPADEYTFNMDYYWAMGDNRHNSADSRYWGFVPEDHLVGKAVFVWLSMDKDKGLFEGKIRWNRIFRSVRSLME